MSFLIALGLVIGIVSGGVSIYEFLKSHKLPGTVYAVVAATLILAALLVSILSSASGSAASGGNQSGNTPTPTLSLQHETSVTSVQETATLPLPPSPTTMPTPKTTTYNVSVSASQDLPGVNTYIVLQAGQHIHITASGSATYGVDGNNNDPCSRGVAPITYPDGTHVVNGTPCPTIARQNVLTCPNSSVGMLCANFGQGWFYVGESFDGIAPIDATLYLIYSDAPGYYGDNSGAYQVTVTVE